MENRPHALSQKARRKFIPCWWLLIKRRSDFMPCILVATINARAEAQVRNTSLALAAG